MDFRVPPGTNIVPGSNPTRQPKIIVPLKGQSQLLSVSSYPKIVFRIAASISGNGCHRYSRACDFYLNLCRTVISFELVQCLQPKIRISFSHSASSWLGSGDDDEELVKSQAETHSMPDRDRLTVKMGYGAVLSYYCFCGGDAMDISQTIGAVGVKV